VQSYPKVKPGQQAILALLILFAILPVWSIGWASPPAETDLPQIEYPYTIFLPIATRNYPRLPSIFGVEVTSLSSAKIDSAKNASVYWTRNFSFSWASIEPVRTSPPTYNWSVVNEAGLIEAAAKGLKVVATVKFTPGWAQKYPGVSCGPVAVNAMDEFAQFMGNLVARYSAPPYHVKYWEIGNEVDIDPGLVPPDNIFGCWGDQDDRYYGGGYFADMLRWVYPAMKAADQDATVLIGGLLLDCDPTNPPPGKSCKPSRFLEGILRNQGGAFFDAVSFHAFAIYSAGQISETSLSWAARGGVLLGKINFLREVMASYGVSKPLMITEAAVVCPEWASDCNPVSSDFLEAQADYVTWLFLRSWAANIGGVMWYTLEDSGWRSSGLHLSNTPKPAYFAYQFAAKELEEATMAGALTQYPGLSGYAFRSPGKRIWVLWSPSRANTVINLPGETLIVYDKYGAVMTPVAGQITVNSPVYIELSP
jgi:hypothetical protein